MILQRRNVADILMPLLRACKIAEKRMGTLAAFLTDVSLKTQFIRNWQRHAECVQDLEEKIRLQGVGSDPILESLEGDVKKRVPEELVDLSVKRLLIDAGDIEEDLTQQYQKTLRHELPVDIRMLLERHVLVFEEIRRHAAAFQQPHDALTPFSDVIPRVTPLEIR